MIRFPECELTAAGLNAKLRCRALSKTKMASHGFELRDDRWCYSTAIPLPQDHGRPGICLYIWVACDSRSWGIDVLDEDSLQPYDYQMILDGAEDPDACAMAVYEFVEAEMESLAKTGIVSGHVRGEYI